MEVGDVVLIIVGNRFNPVYFGLAKITDKDVEWPAYYYKTLHTFFGEHRNLGRMHADWVKPSGLTERELFLYKLKGSITDETIERFEGRISTDWSINGYPT